MPGSLAIATRPWKENLAGQNMRFGVKATDPTQHQLSFLNCAAYPARRYKLSNRINQNELPLIK
ncbi:MAG: hypothetical protein H0X70_09805 [Segetibacter sp.]|nr:hypothetical protein [Segetibacter sp.]